MHSHCKNNQNKRVFPVVAENIVGSLCVLYYVFGVFVPLRNTKKLPNKQKQLIKTKTRSHAKTKASLANIFSFSPQYGARSKATKLKMRPPTISTPVSRAISKWRIGKFWKRLKISFQSCELSMKWTLVSCMSYLWLPVTSTDLIISIENKVLSSNISRSTFLKILFRFNYNHFVIKFLWAVTYIWSPVFTSLPSSNK